MDYNFRKVHQFNDFSLESFAFAEENKLFERFLLLTTVILYELKFGFQVRDLVFFFLPFENDWYWTRKGKQTKIITWLHLFFVLISSSVWTRVEYNDCSFFLIYITIPSNVIFEEFFCLFVIVWNRRKRKKIVSSRIAAKSIWILLNSFAWRIID